MANDITGNPIVLDTASTTAVVVSNQIRITKVLWAGAAIAAADIVVLKDKRSKYKVELGAVGADEHRSQDFNPPLVSDGLIAHTIGHGQVFVYWDGPAPIA